MVARQLKHAPSQILVAKPFMSRLGRYDGQAIQGLNFTFDAGVAKRSAERRNTHAADTPPSTLSEPERKPRRSIVTRL
jgi:hypothetical protein